MKSLLAGGSYNGIRNSGLPASYQRPGVSELGPGLRSSRGDIVMKYTLSDNILRFIVPDYLSLSSRQQTLIRRLFDAVKASDKPLAAMFRERLFEIDGRL